MDGSAGSSRRALWLRWALVLAGALLLSGCSGAGNLSPSPEATFSVGYADPGRYVPSDDAALRDCLETHSGRIHSAAESLPPTFYVLGGGGLEACLRALPDAVVERV